MNRYKWWSAKPRLSGRPNGKHCENCWSESHGNCRNHADGTIQIEPTERHCRDCWALDHESCQEYPGGMRGVTGFAEFVGRMPIRRDLEMIPAENRYDRDIRPPGSLNVA